MAVTSSGPGSGSWSGPVLDVDHQKPNVFGPWAGWTGQTGCFRRKKFPAAFGLVSVSCGACLCVPYNFSQEDLDHPDHPDQANVFGGFVKQVTRTAPGPDLDHSERQERELHRHRPPAGRPHPGRGGRRARGAAGAACAADALRPVAGGGRPWNSGARPRPDRAAPERGRPAHPGSTPLTAYAGEDTWGKMPITGFQIGTAALPSAYGRNRRSTRCLNGRT